MESLFELLQLSKTDTSKEFRQWRANTVQYHYKEHHKYKKIPFDAQLDKRERVKMMEKGNGGKQFKEVTFCSYIAATKEHRYADMDLGQRVENYKTLNTN